MPTKWYQRSQSYPSPRRIARPPVWLLLAALVLVIGITASWWMPALAIVLTVDQPPTRADAIMIMSGGSGSRQDRAIALYQEAFAPLIISSGATPLLPGFERSFAALAADYMVARGVPAEAILLLEDTIDTYDESVRSLQIAQERRWASLLVVSDHYHMRRTSLTFRRVFRGSGIRLTFVAAQPPWFDMSRWWTQERSFMAVVEEYEKLVYYLLRGYLL